MALVGQDLLSNNQWDSLSQYSCSGLAFCRAALSHY